MKLATLKDGSRDGQLIVVSRDLTQAHFAAGIATRLQQVLDDWNFISPQLEDLYATLNGGKARHAFPFEPQRCMAPLPRAYQWIEANAYPAHTQRLAAAGGGTSTGTGAAPALLAQGSSDDFLGPCQDAPFANADWGIDFSAGLAVITGDLRLGATPDEALDGIRLLMLVNAWQLRTGRAAAFAATGAADLAAAQPTAGAAAAPHALPPCRPAAAFAPLAVTPEELGARWQEGRVHGPLSVHWNGRRVGHCDTGAGMQHHFGHWLAQVAQSRRVRAGSILGAGPASGGDAKTQGSSCIAELRAVQAQSELEAKPDSKLEPQATQGLQAPAAYMQWGDTVRMEMLGENGQSIFGALEQRVVSAESAAAQAEAEAKAMAIQTPKATARASSWSAETGANSADEGVVAAGGAAEPEAVEVGTEAAPAASPNDAPLQALDTGPDVTRSPAADHAAGSERPGGDEGEAAASEDVDADAHAHAHAHADADADAPADPDGAMAAPTQPKPQPKARPQPKLKSKTKPAGKPAADATKG